MDCLFRVVFFILNLILLDLLTFNKSLKIFNTGWAIRSHSSARFSFELSVNSN